MQGWCTGATMADVNGDGKLDIYICRSADTDPAKRRNLLFINNGDLTFTEEAAQYGLADEGYSTQAVFFDYDKDGDLDMFLVNHSLQHYATGDYENANLRKEQNPAFANKLFRNDHGHFTDVSREAGITSNVLTFGLGVAVSDFNDDGWPDIYVSNDFNEPDYLFINNGNGTFTEKLRDCMDQVSLYSMGCDAADFNNDGKIDLLTLDMLPEDNWSQKMHTGAENFDKFQMLFSQGVSPSTAGICCTGTMGMVRSVKWPSLQACQILTGAGPPSLLILIMMAGKIFLSVMVMRKIMSIWISCGIA